VYDEATGKQTATLDHGDDVNTTGHSNIVHAVNWKPNDPNVSAFLNLTTKVILHSVQGLMPYLMMPQVQVEQNEWHAVSDWAVLHIKWERLKAHSRPDLQTYLT
jgi:hypothetical protein